MSDVGRRIPFWVVVMEGGAADVASRLDDDLPEFGVTNYDGVWSGKYRVWDERGVSRPYLEDARYDRFDPAPRYVTPASFHPDYVDWSLLLASPKLFGLLDQPRGSIQGWPTDTAWLGDGPPDWAYLWLCYVPTVPAVDLDRSDVSVEHLDKDGAKVPRIGRKGALVLRGDLRPPCGLFKAAEGGSLLLATDAVAGAVVRAGCGGIEFLDPATAFARDAVVLRRGPDGPEVRPPSRVDPGPPVQRRWDADLPPVGPRLAWDVSPVEWLDWEPADAALDEPIASKESGEAGDALAQFVRYGIFFSETAAEDVLAAVAEVRAGKRGLRVLELSPWVVVLRFDAAWLRLEDAVEGYRPFAYPLDGMAAVVERWAEAVRRAPNPLTPKA